MRNQKSNISKSSCVGLWLLSAMAVPLAIVPLAMTPLAVVGQDLDHKPVKHSKPTVTFNSDIGPMIHKRCSSCHRPGQAGPFSLLDYKDVAKRAQTIAAVVESGYICLLYTSPSPRDATLSRMPSSA